MGLKYGTPLHPEFPIVSFIGAILVLLPISSHWKARNVATLSMIAWLFTINIYRFVNTLEWANNVDIKLAVWCDITTKLTVGITVALPAAALCICRYLEAVASVRWARQTEAQKRNRMLFELFMCFGLPIIIMAIHYISQGHRFDIYEHMGCEPAVVRTWVAILTLYIPPLVLSLIAFVYATLAIRHFYRRRVDFRKHLSASNSGISASRYLRLMLLALSEMILDTTCNIYVIWVNVTQWGGLVKYDSWASIHYGFSRIQPYPVLFLPPSFWKQQIILWWIIPVATFMFWSFFAFGQESIAEYKSWWNWFQRKVLRRKNVLPLGMSQLGSSTRVGAKGGSSSGGSSVTKKGSSGPGPRIHMPSFPSARKGTKKLEDDDSFVSAEELDMSEKGLPLSPISPVDVATTPRMPNHYMDAELDTSVFDTISHISVSDAENDLDSPTISGSPVALKPSSLRSHQPYAHPGANESGTFVNTAVRADTPNVHTNNVRVATEVAIDVV